MVTGEVSILSVWLGKGGEIWEVVAGRTTVGPWHRQFGLRIIDHPALVGRRGSLRPRNGTLIKVVQALQVLGALGGQDVGGGTPIEKKKSLRDSAGKKRRGTVNRR